MPPLLKAQNLTKYYPGTTALKQINLTLEANTILGLLGLNGSGKSTFMRLAAGQTRPSAGEIFIKGMHPGLQTRALTSYMPEYDHIYNWMTVKESINFFSSFFPRLRKSISTGATLYPNRPMPAFQYNGPANFPCISAEKRKISRLNL